MNNPKKGIYAMLEKRLRSIALRLAAAVFAVGLMLSATQSHAGVISNGPFDLGINSNYGSVYDSGIGFLRTADGYDPIAPGVPREAWGVSAGALAGFADPYEYGIQNVSSGTLVINGAGTSATITNYLQDASFNNVLGVSQSYNFLTGSNSNVVVITESITNVSGVAQAVMFARNVDYDVYPTEFNENTLVSKISGPITAASYYGFENPSPLAPFGSPATVGTVYGPNDLGTGFQLSLGTLAAGATTTFDVYYALNMIGQSPSSLTSQVASLGPMSGISTGFSSDGDFNTATNSIVLAIGPVAGAVPEPSSVALLAIGAMSCLGMTWHRRRKS